jgi:hypothetical protein
VAEPRLSYQKLSRKAFNWLGACRIWQGADHLLEVASTIGVERYRRFYFRDVEAILIRRTAQRALWNALLGVATAGLLGLATVLFQFSEGAASGSATFSITLGFCGGLGLAAILWNSVAGETCAVLLQTRTGMKKLRGFNRLRPTRRALERLRGQIMAAQTEPPRLPGE